MKNIIVSLLLFFAALDAHAKDSISVYLFLLDDCVICQNYTTELNDIYTSYVDDVNFIGYFPNFSSKPEKISAFEKKYNIKFPLKTDYYKTMAAQFEATVTPEVVVYNHDLDEIIYQGRIDNRYVRIGKRRNVITSSELRNVLESISKGKPIVSSKTQPVGCYINYSDAISKYSLEKQ